MRLKHTTSGYKQKPDLANLVDPQAHLNVLLQLGHLTRLSLCQDDNMAALNASIASAPFGNWQNTAEAEAELEHIHGGC